MKEDRGSRNVSVASTFTGTSRMRWPSGSVSLPSSGRNIPPEIRVSGTLVVSVTLIQDVDLMASKYSQQPDRRRSWPWRSRSSDRYSPFVALHFPTPFEIVHLLHEISAGSPRCRVLRTALAIRIMAKAASVHVRSSAMRHNIGHCGWSTGNQSAGTKQSLICAR